MMGGVKLTREDLDVGGGGGIPAVLKNINL